MSTEITMLPHSNQFANDRSSAWQFLKRLSGFAILVVFAVQAAGCSTMRSNGILQAPITGYRNHVWAQRAYNLRYADCTRKFSEDFERGFKDGYSDVCNGGDGFVPATAPQCYWGFEFQTPDGAKCVNSWFTSYALGAAAAKKDGAGSFRDVYISKMINSAVAQDEAEHVLPDDVPVLAPKRQAAEVAPMQAPVSQPSQPPIIQSSSFVPSDPNMQVPAWNMNAGNSRQ